MQIKNNHSNNLQKSWIIALIKGMLFIGCLFFIYGKLREQSISLSEIHWPEDTIKIISIVSVLMIVNWYLEALRWKVSISQFESISHKESLQAVLGGLALNWVFPFTSGDLMARIAQQQDKFQSTSAAILNRGIMLTLTLILGLYGMNFLAQAYDWNGWLLVVILLGVPLIRWLFKNSIKRFAVYFLELSKERLIQVIFISASRYAVFVFQFYLLLHAFLPGLNSSLIIAGIGWVFLVRSTLPLFFGGVGVREASGVVFFEAYVTNLELVIIPIFLIWLINTVVPSLVGLIFIMKYKIR